MHQEGVIALSQENKLHDTETMLNLQSIIEIIEVCLC